MELVGAIELAEIMELEAGMELAEDMALETEPAPWTVKGPK